MQRVFVLSAKIPLPPHDASDEVLSGFSRRILPVLSEIRKLAKDVYPSEEFEAEGFYCREWAIQIKPEALSRISLNTEFFSLREVTTDEIFLAKYQDFVLKADSIILLAPGESVL